MLLKIYNLLNKDHKLYAYYVIFLMVVGMIFEVLGIAMVIPAIYIILESNIYDLVYFSFLDSFLRTFNQSQLIIIIMLLLGAIYLFKSIFIGFLSWVQSSFAFNVGANLSERLYNGYLNQEYTEHTKKSSPELIRNLTVEINLVTGAITQSLQIATELIILTGIISILVFIEPYGTLISLFIFLLAGSIFYLITSKYIYRWGLKRQEDEKNRNKRIQESFTGFKEIKLLGKFNYFKNKYHSSNSSLARIGALIQTLSNIPRLYIETLMVICIVSFIIYSISNGYSSTQVISSIAILGAAGFRVLPSLNKIYTAIQHLKFSSPAISLVSKELDLIEEIASKGKLEKKINFHNDIVLKDIEFFYKNDNEHIIGPNLNLRVKINTFIGISGSSGSGKSTLINLITGLLKPKKGEILVDSQNINVNLNSWQNQIGYVSQKSYLLNDTIKRNIAFGVEDEDINMDLISYASEVAEISDFIEKLDQGLETVIGENGLNISGGQMQRLTIARALYNKPKIIIFDEATNAVDSKTEDEIIKTIYNIESVTVFLISHNLELLEKCDYIFQLENGLLS